MNYIKKLSTNPIAKKVKIADLMHNSDNTRLSVIDDYAKKRCQKYKESLEILTENEKL